MADSELGGDPVQMNDLAGYLAKKAAEIDGNVNDLRAKSRAVMWVGARTPTPIAAPRSTGNCASHRRRHGQPAIGREDAHRAGPWTGAGLGQLALEG